VSATAMRTVEPREVCLCRAETRVDGCEMCRVFRCAGCKRWRSWGLGAADDMPGHCDDCWAKAHGKAAERRREDGPQRRLWEDRR
jgi:hypothetical protein